jgi:hypothetical protein
MGIGLPIEQIANEDFEKELKEKTKNIDDTPHAPPPDTPDIIFYYEETQTRTIVQQGIYGTDDLHTNYAYTYTLYYSYNENKLDEHRNKIINERSGNNAFPPKENNGEVSVVRPGLNGSKIEFKFSIIKSETRPSRISKPKSSTSIETTKGTFLQNKTGNFR